MKWFDPIPLSRWEMIWMRSLLGLWIIWSFPLAMNQGAQPKPVGLAHFFDLTFFSDFETLQWIRLVLIVATGFYAAGLFLPLTLPLITTIFIAMGSLNNSHGSITHHFQIIGLLLLAQCTWHVVGAVFGYRGRRHFLRSSVELDRVGVHMASQAIAAVYVVSAITKLWRSDGGWVSQAKNYPLQILKTQAMEYYNVLGETDPSLWESFASWFANFLLRWPLFGQGMLALALVLELFAFLALLSRKWMLGMGIVLIGLHASISAVMNLHFETHMAVLAIFWVNAPYWFSRLWLRPASLD